MTTYLVGYNQPGYLPDVEPVDFDDLGEAYTYLVDRVRIELEWTEEHYEEFGMGGRAVEHNRHALADIEAREPQLAYVHMLEVNGWSLVYWLEEAI